MKTLITIAVIGFSLWSMYGFFLALKHTNFCDAKKITDLKLIPTICAVLSIIGFCFLPAYLTFLPHFHI
jgi:hypothetical protein